MDGTEQPLAEAAGQGRADFREPATLSAVAKFHRLFKCPVLNTPQIPDAKRCALRISLLQEELNEMKAAIEQNDLVEVADALADIQYVLSGAVHEFGLGSRFADLFDEVQRSNMSKACQDRDEAESTVAHCACAAAIIVAADPYSDLPMPPICLRSPLACVDAAKGQPAHIAEVDGQLLVYRTVDNKVLKSVGYSPAALRDIIGEENIPIKKDMQ